MQIECNDLIIPQELLNILDATGNLRNDLSPETIQTILEWLDSENEYSTSESKIVTAATASTVSSLLIDSLGYIVQNAIRTKRQECRILELEAALATFLSMNNN